MHNFPTVFFGSLVIAIAILIVMINLARDFAVALFITLLGMAAIVYSIPSIR